MASNGSDKDLWCCIEQFRGPPFELKGAVADVDAFAVAVGTALCPVGLGPPPARIPASGTTALGSCLGSKRQSARQAMDAARGPVGSIVAQGPSFAPSSSDPAGFDAARRAATFG